MANFFVLELDRISKDLEITQARYNREFIEKRYEENKQDLAKAEQNFKRFQEKHNVIALPEQLQAAIVAAAGIKAQIISAEVRLDALKASFKPEHPEIRKIQTEINGLRSALNKLQYGENSSTSTLALFPAFSEAPELGIQFVQLKRELEVQNKLYEFLTQQYEKAKIQETKDTPTVQILDKAIPPIKRSKPSRKRMVLMWAVLSIFISALLVFILDYLSSTKHRNSSQYQKAIEIIEMIKSDYHRSPPGK